MGVFHDIFFYMFAKSTSNTRKKNRTYLHVARSNAEEFRLMYTSLFSSQIQPYAYIPTIVRGRILITYLHMLF
jgi:hypothetical protein